MHWIFSVAGIALTVSSAYHLWYGWRSAAWPAAEGEVLARVVRERRSRRGPYFDPEVRYRYAVGGREHTGRRLRFGAVEARARDPQALHHLLVGLEAGARVPVYYDPRAPRRSVLRPGYWRPDWIGVAFGIAFVWVGVQA